jgi:hypothetical protein
LKIKKLQSQLKKLEKKLGIEVHAYNHSYSGASPCLKNKIRAGSVASMMKALPSKHEVLCANPSTTEKI